ncbi:chemotaxis protein CheA [Imbroritus primus]|uniref:chemotaxis protein CheA n=1 Tax=Imbroritus primus TaxID=3058603 RepID=UPI003D160745
MTIDIRQFYDTFFEEADELLIEMERQLLALDPAAPDVEALHAIFRAAHSIKGGAATFGFQHMTELTHVLESILDRARTGALALREDMVDAFLETKDVLNAQIDAYRHEQPIDTDTLAYMVERLQRIAGEPAGDVPAPAVSMPAPTVETPLPIPAPAAAGTDVAAGPVLDIRLNDIADSDCELLIAELGHLGQVLTHARTGTDSHVRLATACSPDDIVAVCCFIIDAEQIAITPEVSSLASAAIAVDTTPAAQPDTVHTAAGNAAGTSGPVAPSTPVRERPASQGTGHAESSSIRVGIEKVDQLINLVGELVITQAMLAQTATSLDGVAHERLLNGLSQLTRNARDLQESVMSIRMMPMEYVFSRFPRLVRDLAHKLGKQVELVTAGQSTELDKGLIERIIDPLNHLVRNSLDHGLESPDERRAAGKDAVGRLFLSAAHQGGNIVIEVGDDGRGLDHDKILRKARAQGMALPDTLTEDEIAQLIFAPGFSTADAVTDVSGRGVGMDVVRQNIKSMGGYVEVRSQRGQGTTIRIVLPLTLAILDGMSVKVGDEIFILPLSCVSESLQPRHEDLKSVPGRGALLQVRNEYVPLVPLSARFDIVPAIPRPEDGIVVILEAEGRKIALQVDELVGQQQVVVKNLETNYRRVPGISGATILGDGSVALIIDVGMLMREPRQAAFGHSVLPEHAVNPDQGSHNTLERAQAAGEAGQGAARIAA